MLASLRSVAAAVVLAAAACVPIVGVGSCGGGGAAGMTGTTTASTAAGGATTTTSAGGANTTSTFVIPSSGGGGSTMTCGGPDAAPDVGPDAPTGCEGVDGGGVTFADVAPIFGGACNIECHTPWEPQSLVNIPAYECCDGLPLVTPGNPNESYLMDKLEGHALCQGHRMPLSGPPYLTDDQIAIVRAWICAGAPQ
jgi:hypothetical protein